MVQEWREIRDLFVDVNEKVLAPLDALDMTLEQVCVLVRATVVMWLLLCLLLCLRVLRV